MSHPTGPTALPDKEYFKIGEVCELTGLKSHTLRYWESEFSLIRPVRAGSQQRLYRKIDVENILKIKKLIHEDKLTLAGARKFLARESQRGQEHDTPVVMADKQILKTIKEELIAIKDLLQ